MTLAVKVTLNPNTTNQSKTVTLIFVENFADKQTAKQTGQKLYASYQSILGHNKEPSPGSSVGIILDMRMMSQWLAQPISFQGMIPLSWLTIVSRAVM